jgi:hypothetical protein
MMSATCHKCKHEKVSVCKEPCKSCLSTATDLVAMKYLNFEPKEKKT